MQCETCKKWLRGVQYLQFHAKKHITSNEEERVKYKCKLCNYATHTRHALNIHEARLHHPKNLKCTHCDFKASDPYILGLHRKNVHEALTYQCDPCQIFIKGKFQFVSHFKKIHLSEARRLKASKTQKVVTCNTCSYRPQQRHLAGHQIIHTARTGKFRCVACGENCNSIIMLKKHFKKCLES